MKVTKGKKLVVYFGGVISQQDTKEEIEEAILKLRKAIVEGLNVEKCMMSQIFMQQHLISRISTR